MQTNIQDFLNSRFAVGFALILSRFLPPSLGYPIAHWIAGLVSSFKGANIVRAVRLNQWVANQGKLSCSQLGELTQETFRSTARSLFDFYHNLQNDSAFRKLVHFSSEIKQYVRWSQEGNRPIIFVCPHLGNIDFAGRAISMLGLRAQVLTFPSPGAGYRWQNKIRISGGMEITPISTKSLRMAADRLNAGGCILTGLDRPLPDSKYRSNFFGLPAPMPTLHVRLALKTNAPVVVVANIRQPDGLYLVSGSDLIEMESRSDPHEEVITNTENVLRIAEAFIMQAPDQWSMFYPVWPELENRIPAC